MRVVLISVALVLLAGCISMSKEQNSLWNKCETQIRYGETCHKDFRCMRKIKRQYSRLQHKKDWRRYLHVHGCKTVGK